MLNCSVFDLYGPPMKKSVIIPLPISLIIKSIKAVLGVGKCKVSTLDSTEQFRTLLFKNTI